MLSSSLVLYLWSWQIYVFDIKIKPNLLPLSVHKILVDLWWKKKSKITEMLCTTLVNLLFILLLYLGIVLSSQRNLLKLFKLPVFNFTSLWNICFAIILLKNTWIIIKESKFWAKKSVIHLFLCIIKNIQDAPALWDGFRRIKKSIYPKLIINCYILSHW